MDILIIIGLIIAGVLLFLVELFITPGLSVAGVSSAVCLLYANYYAFINMGTSMGFITLAISSIACIIAVVWLMRSKTLDKLVLKKDITSKVDKASEEKVNVGDKGVAITRLALIGNADIDGSIVEVKSTDGFINENTPVIVERVINGIILVKRL